MAELSVNDPKVIEMSYDILEKIITAIDYKSKEELLKLADIMIQKVESDNKYPEIMRLAYKDAKNKIEVLTLEQINEIKTIITSD